MTYCHVTNGVIDAGPGPLPSSWRNISGLDKTTDPAKLAALGWYPVVDGGPGNAPNQVIEGHTLDFDGSKVVVTWQTKTLTAGEIKEQRIAALADKKYQVETSGIVWNGWPVDTDRESQFKLGMAYMLARDGFWNDGWKFADGVYRTLTRDEIIALALAVGAHTQACYATEAAKKLDDSDINTGWPS